MKKTIKLLKQIIIKNTKTLKRSQSKNNIKITYIEIRRR